MDVRQFCLGFRCAQSRLDFFIRARRDAGADVMKASLARREHPAQGRHPFELDPLGVELGAGSERPFALAGECMGGERDDRDVPRLRVVLEVTRRLPAVRKCAPRERDGLVDMVNIAIGRAAISIRSSPRKRRPMITGRCSWVPALAALGRDDDGRMHFG